MEIWEWKEREGGKIGRKVSKVGYGLNTRTSGYIVKEELQREKMKRRAGRKAWRFERRLWKGRGGNWRGNV